LTSAEGRKQGLFGRHIDRLLGWGHPEGHPHRLLVVWMTVLVTVTMAQAIHVTFLKARAGRLHAVTTGGVLFRPTARAPIAELFNVGDAALVAGNRMVPPTDGWDGRLVVVDQLHHVCLLAGRGAVRLPAHGSLDVRLRLLCFTAATDARRR
jgi:hypothetical protein